MDTKNPLLVRLTGAPDFWRYTPVEMKAPYLKYKIIDGKKEKFSWKDRPLKLEEIFLEENTSPLHITTGIGLLLGEESETMAIDLDGVGADRNFERQFGFPATDLPPTICTTSGRPRRKQS